MKQQWKGKINQYIPFIILSVINIVFKKTDDFFTNKYNII